MGSVKGEMMSPRTQDALKRFGDLEMIDVQISTNAGFLSHGSCVENPAVFSDLILLLGDGRALGLDNGRPKQQNESGFWQLTDGYPH